jgi:hypothetical protein
MPATWKYFPPLPPVFNNMCPKELGPDPLTTTTHVREKSNIVAEQNKSRSPSYVIYLSYKTGDLLVFDLDLLTLTSHLYFHHLQSPDPWVLPAHRARPTFLILPNRRY